MSQPSSCCVLRLNGECGVLKNASKLLLYNKCVPGASIGKLKLRSN